MNGLSGQPLTSTPAPAQQPEAGSYADPNTGYAAQWESSVSRDGSRTTVSGNTAGSNQPGQPATAPQQTRPAGMPAQPQVTVAVGPGPPVGNTARPAYNGAASRPVQDTRQVSYQIKPSLPLSSRVLGPFWW